MCVNYYATTHCVYVSIFHVCIFVLPMPSSQKGGNEILVFKDKISQEEGTAKQNAKPKSWLQKQSI